MNATHDPCKLVNSSRLFKQLHTGAVSALHLGFGNLVVLVSGGCNLCRMGNGKHLGVFADLPQLDTDLLGGLSGNTRVNLVKDDGRGRFLILYPIPRYLMNPSR